MKGGGKNKSAGRTAADDDGEQPPLAERGEEVDDLSAGEEDGGEDRPWFPEGFYEIEAVRKKRVRKGKAQYFIKWRGYPETENTWEPKKNLMACLDFIQAFEKSSRLGKHSTARRGKRKSEVTQSRPEKKNKQQSAPDAATYNVPAVSVRIIDNPLPIDPLDGSSSPACPRVGSVGSINDVEVSSQAMEMGCGAVPTQNKDVEVGELRGTPRRQEKMGSVLFAEDPAKIDDLEQDQPERLIGSRRRKSGSVKKFTISSMSREAMDEQNGTSLSTNGGCGRFESLESKVPSGLGSDLNRENESDFPKSMTTITKIVKVISYAISRGACDALVTFMAKRSDGREVIVDNKFLKTNNPLLLINFYEEHLSYNPVR